LNFFNTIQARTSPYENQSLIHSEVRRSVLFNLEQTRATILFIIERARDVDAINRRCVYSRSMNEIGDFRILSIGNRERILRWGLRDRDPNTKKAAVRMFAHKWVEQANNNVLEVCSMEFWYLTKLLERLDVVNSKIADEAMRSFFESRPEVLDSFIFNGINPYEKILTKTHIGIISLRNQPFLRAPSSNFVIKRKTLVN
jgi:hypothetical protein